MEISHILVVEKKIHMGKYTTRCHILNPFTVNKDLKAELVNFFAIKTQSS